ncbi:MAG: phosphoserine phosphatase SerB [Pseudomonadota bacterium]
MVSNDVFNDRIATLIAHPDNPCLTPERAGKAQNALGASAVYFLADGVACDIPLPPACEAPDEALRSVLSGHPIDIVVQNANERRKKALLADMDSTLIHQECIDELADAAGIGAQVADITARAMAGELDFEPALRERVKLLKGQPETLIERVLDERIQLRSGGRELVATMKHNGAHCVLVSGGFVQFTQSVADRLGFDEHHANSFIFENGLFTGDVQNPILGREAKVEALDRVVAEHGLDLEDVMAVGDGANDLGMINRAGCGVALHAKPIVAEQADVRIDHGDLTALLYIQGYRKSDFVS